jgi:aminoglycoside phosphotransferase (APT) family kinase protein
VGFRGPVSIRQFKGGQSNPTYRLDSASGVHVLRRKPPGKLLPSAHAIEREFRVMQALGKAGFPVPTVRQLCEDPAVIGTAFYVMDLVEGRVIWEPAMPGSDAAERAAVYGAMIAALARLHSFDPAAIGLADFGRGENYVARQIARWAEQYRASRTDDIPEMERLIAWLPQHAPTQNRVAVVHGDFRLDNIILAVGRPEILAVLDWELSTLGDPVADFTYSLMQWAMPPSESGAGTGSLVGADLAMLGIPDMAAAIEAYEAGTGLSVRPHLDLYLAYNFFRIAAILQGIVGRVRDGTATNPNAAAMAAQVRPIAETAWRFAKRAGAI